MYSGVVKRLWGFGKVRYRGLQRTPRAFTALALANIYLAEGACWDRGAPVSGGESGLKARELPKWAVREAKTSENCVVQCRTANHDGLFSVALRVGMQPKRTHRRRSQATVPEFRTDRVIHGVPPTEEDDLVPPDQPEVPSANTGTAIREASLTGFHPVRHNLTHGLKRKILFAMASGGLMLVPEIRQSSRTICRTHE